MNIDAKIYIIVGIISTAIAQISLKVSSGYNILNVKWVMWVLVSLFSYVISFVSYYMALKFFDISKVQPIMMAGIISIISLYGFAVGESFNRLRLAGILLSIVSVYLISKS
jgi:drug/metabolite transporter (DMT)-like permease